MSVCDDERWVTPSWQPGYFHWCPCYCECESDRSCGLEVFEGHCEYNFKTNEHQDLRPDSCPFADILRALPTASDEQIEAATAILTGADCRSCVHADNARRRPWCEIAGRYNPDLCECYKKNPERADPGKGGDESE